MPPVQKTPERVVVRERGQPMPYSYAELAKYHGVGSPAGVALAFAVMRLAFPLLAPGGPERREVTVATAFPGPGARDGFEMVTRAVSDGRYTVDRALARPGAGAFAGLCVFTVGYRGAEVSLAVRDGVIGAEFADLALLKGRTQAQEDRLDVLKLDLAALVLDLPPERVYQVLG